MTKQYFKTNEKEVTDLTDQEIEKLYDQGYVLTRLPVMQQTRSLRIELSKFELSSENRRILRKTENLKLITSDLPLEVDPENSKIIRMGKNFYQEKFDDVTFTANKLRALLYKKDPSKFNLLFSYNMQESTTSNKLLATGYTICYKTDNILHYAYPFYDLESDIPNLGMGMMLNAILWSKEQNLKYVYIGSATSPKDKYKLQFEGLEWFDRGKWQENLSTLKQTLETK